MEALLGFQVSRWNYVTFAAIAIIILAGLAPADEGPLTLDRSRGLDPAPCPVPLGLGG
jgi:hypothetical protein